MNLFSVRTLNFIASYKLSNGMECRHSDRCFVIKKDIFKMVIFIVNNILCRCKPFKALKIYLPIGSITEGSEIDAIQTVGRLIEQINKCLSGFK